MMHDNYDPAKEKIVPVDGAPQYDGIYIIYVPVPKECNMSNAMFVNKTGDSYYLLSTGLLLDDIIKVKGISKHIGPIPYKA